MTSARPRCIGPAMGSWVRQSGAGRSIFAIALLLALSVRALIPAGFMPTATSDGITVSICTGLGEKQVTLDAGKQAPAKKHPAADSPCLFAGTLDHAIAAGIPARLAAAPPIALPLVWGTAIADLTVHRLAAPPPLPTGPPAPR